MEQIKETAFDWTSRDEQGYFTTNERHMIQRMLDYAAARPGEVTITNTPETNAGYLMARIPKSWIKIKPPIKRDLTDEQRANIGEKLSESRNNALRDKHSHRAENSRNRHD